MQLVLIALLWGSSIAASLLPALPSAFAQQRGGAHGPPVTPTTTPSVTVTAKAITTGRPNGPRFNDRESLLKQYDKYLLEVEGKMRGNPDVYDRNGNGIPDFRETYTVDWWDCSEHSWVFQRTMAKMAEDGWIDYDQGMGVQQIRGSGHAANIVPGIGEVDLTPVQYGDSFVASKGTPWHSWSRGYTPYDVGFPDGGHQFFSGLDNSSASTAAGVFVPGKGSTGGGFLGGAGGGLWSMMGLMNQLNKGRGGGAGSLSGLSGSTLPSKAGSKSPATQPSKVVAPKAPVVASPVPQPPAAKSPVPAPPKGGAAMPIPPANPGVSALNPGAKQLQPTDPAKQDTLKAVPAVPSAGALKEAATAIFKDGSLTVGAKPAEPAVPSAVDAETGSGTLYKAGSDVVSDGTRPSAWDIPAGPGAVVTPGASKGFF